MANGGKMMNTGLDIGANSIKAVAIEPTKTGFTLLAASDCRLSSDSTEDGFIADYGELVQGIKNITEKGNFPSKFAATALKGPSTFARKLSIYCESVSELKETFPWIIDQYVCLDPEEMSLDFEVLGEGERYHHLKLLVVGARKDTITDMVSVIESSKMTPKVIEPEGMSLARLFRALNPVKAGVSMLLHIGYVGSAAVLLSDGVFDFSGEISIGGKYCTEIVMEELSLNRDEAEQIKKNPAAHSDPDAARAALVDRFCRPLADQAEKILRLYTHKGGNAPYKIVLSGGACETYGLTDVLSERFSAVVEYLDPWKVVSLPKEFEKNIEAAGKYSYNIAIGLAMTGKVY